MSHEHRFFLTTALVYKLAAHGACKNIFWLHLRFRPLSSTVTPVMSVDGRRDRNKEQNMTQLQDQYSRNKVCAVLLLLLLLPHNKATYHIVVHAISKHTFPGSKSEIARFRCWPSFPTLKGSWRGKLSTRMYHVCVHRVSHQQQQRRKPTTDL